MWSDRHLSRLARLGAVHDPITRGAGGSRSRTTGVSTRSSSSTRWPSVERRRSSRCWIGAPSPDPSGSARNGVALVALFERDERPAERSGTHSSQPRGRAPTARTRHCGSAPTTQPSQWPPFFHHDGSLCSRCSRRSPPAPPLSPTPRFEPDDFVRTLAEHQVTFLAAPPPGRAGARRTSGGRAARPCTRAGRVRRCPAAGRDAGGGGAPVPNAVVGQGWGMTETTVAASRATREAGVRLGRSTRPDPGSASSTPAGRDVPAGERASYGRVRS